ncbi:MAG: hypothetical protein IJY12_02850 [Clostridia bacterium]|nr:hypothetical protein [Clostridia bacterium]
MKKNRNKTKVARIIHAIVLLSVSLPIIFLVIKIVQMSVAPPEETYRNVADYVLMLVECILGILVIELPDILEAKFNVVTPPRIYLLYLIFLYCSIFLGEVASFYYRVPYWDDMLHAMSSMMLGALGLSLVMVLNRDRHVLVKLSPAFISVFAFCFAVSIGAIWEIYEFTLDGILGLNMQKYAVEGGGEDLIGRLALIDTMQDIIIDCLGALFISVIGYISNKRNKNWLSKWTFTVKPKEEPVALEDPVALEEPEDAKNNKTSVEC